MIQGNWLCADKGRLENRNRAGFRYYAERGQNIPNSLTSTALLTMEGSQAYLNDKNESHSENLRPPVSRKVRFIFEKVFSLSS